MNASEQQGVQIKVGKKPVSWKEWAERWNRDDLSHFERMGLLHYGFHIFSMASQGGSLTEDMIDRLSLYIRLANTAGCEVVSDERRELGDKALAILISKVVGDSQRISPGPNLFAMTSGSLLPLFVSLFCDRGADGRCNWSFRKSGGDVIDVGMSSVFSWFFRQRCFVMDSPTRLELVQSKELDRVVQTAFLEMPAEFSIMMKAIIESAPAAFQESNLRDLVRWVTWNSGYDKYPLPELLLDDECRQELTDRVSEKLCGRTIHGPINHWQAIVLVGSVIHTYS